ncbi:MAG: hypothetical protein ACI9VT_004002 [Psychroserpens sp.]|jgi:hypothetical protein
MLDQLIQPLSMSQTGKLYSHHLVHLLCQFDQPWHKEQGSIVFKLTNLINLKGYSISSKRTPRVSLIYFTTKKILINADMVYKP